ncbi:hypothetical protein [Xylanibacter rarus]|uniref:hypothetical protein n=1 Tax=Xylanibacter rarus TaxID=1676614 RepID=UPI003FF06AE2
MKRGRKRRLCDTPQASHKAQPADLRKGCLISMRSNAVKSRKDRNGNRDECK